MSNKSDNTKPRPKSVSSYFLLGIAAVELLAALVPYEDIQDLGLYFQLEFLFLCAATLCYVKWDAVFVLFAYSLWQTVSDRLWAYPQWIGVMEASILWMLLWWIYRRPERIPSDPIGDTVCLAFYYGDKAPLIAKISSILSLPYTGIAVIIKDRAMVPRGKEKKIICRHPETLHPWTIVDTYIKPTPEILEAFNQLEGKPMGKAKCMKTMTPFLDKLGFGRSRDPADYLLRVLAQR